MRHEAEIYSQLRTQKGQDNQESNENHHPIRLKSGKLFSCYIGEQTHRNTSPIKRWQWKQIEDCQNDIDDEGVLQVQGNPLRNDDRQIDDNVKAQGSDDCQANVH